MNIYIAASNSKTAKDPCGSKLAEDLREIIELAQEPIYKIT
jgi:hypothetical protein